jgi:hypothetical protein
MNLNECTMNLDAQNIKAQTLFVNVLHYFWVHAMFECCHDLVCINNDKLQIS